MEHLIIVILSSIIIFASGVVVGNCSGRFFKRRKIRNLIKNLEIVDKLLQEEIKKKEEENE